MKGFEFGIGIGADSKDGFDPSNWILEAKFVPGDLEERGSAVGITSGLLFDFNGDIEEIYAYFPYSRMILDNTSVFHLNVSFEAVREEDWEYELITGFRGDFGIPTTWPSAGLWVTLCRKVMYATLRNASIGR